MTRDITLEDTVYIAFSTRAFATGAPTTLAGSPVVSAYEDASLTQITAGITLGVDHDSVTGLHMLTIVATAANGYESGKDYNLVITTGTVDSVSVVGEVVGQFTIARSAAAVDLANGTDGLGAIKTDTAAIKVKTDFLPSATAGAAGGVFIAGTNAATVVTTSFTTTFTGNLTGSVGSVTGAVGSVTGAVGSVTGSVGSVVGHTAQTGDTYALANGATGFAAIDTVVDAILVDTGTTLPATLATASALSTAQSDLDIITGATGVNLLAATQASIDAIETDTADMQPKIGTITDLGAGATLGNNLSDMAGATFSTASDSLEAIRDRGDAEWTTAAGGSDRLLMVDTTIATLSSQVSFTLSAGSTDDDAYNGCTIVIEDVSTSTQKAVGIVDDYTGSTKTVTLLEDPAVFTMATTDKVYILAERALKPTVGANYHVDVTSGGSVGVDWGNVENQTTAVDLSATDIQLCDTVTTYTGNTPQTGDTFALANGAAGFVAIDTVVDAILVDTGTTIPATISTAQADLDTITGADGVNLLSATQASIDAIEADTNELQTDDVPGLIAALNNISTSQVNTEVDTALSDIGLDHLISASVTGTDVADDSIIAQMVSSMATADWDTYNNASDSLEAAATAYGLINSIATDILVDTGTTIPATISTAQADLDTITGADGVNLLSATQASIDAIEADTNSLQTEWADGGRLDALLDTAGDPMSTSVPASYGAGTAGYLIGTYLDAAVSGTSGTTGSVLTVTLSNDSSELVDGSQVSLQTTGGVMLGVYDTTGAASGNNPGVVVLTYPDGSYLLKVTDRSGYVTHTAEAVTISGATSKAITVTVDTGTPDGEGWPSG